MDAIICVSDDEVLHRSRWPFSVTRATSDQPSERVADDRLKLMFVTHGSARFAYRGGASDLRAGDYAVLDHGEWVQCSPAGTVSITTVHADPMYLNERSVWSSSVAQILRPCLTNAPLDPVPPFQIGTLTPTQYLAADTLLRSLLNRQPDETTTPRSLLSTTADLAQLFDVMADSHVTFGAGATVLKATHLLSSHLAEAWTIEKLARAVTVSISQLNRLFREQLEMSPAAFLRALRARKMAELLRTTSLTIEHAARQVGWLDPSHAARSFRQEIGLTPRQFRVTPVLVAHHAALNPEHA